MLASGRPFDTVEELGPAVSLEVGVRNLLVAEVAHGEHVVVDLLGLESGDRDLLQVDDQVVLDDLIILDVFLCLRDVLEDALGLGGLSGRRFEETLEGELTSVHLVNGIFVVPDLRYGLGLGSLNSFLTGDALDESVELHDLSLDPVSDVLEGILDALCCVCKL